MSFWHRLGVFELCSVLFWRDALAEFCGTWFLLVFLTSNQIDYFDWFRPTPTHVGLVQGLTLFVMIEALSHISGGHINTGVTFVAVLRRQISVIKGKHESTLE